MSEDPKIQTVHNKIQDLINSAELTPQEAINCISELLAFTVLVLMETEQQSHELLNRCDVSMHEFINENWRRVYQMKDIQEKIIQRELKKGKQ